MTAKPTPDYFEAFQKQVDGAWYARRIRGESGDVVAEIGPAPDGDAIVRLCVASDPELAVSVDMRIEEREGLVDLIEVD